jgi:hypothetical protein
MSAEKLTQRALLAAAVALQDLMHIVDVSDTSQSPNGSSYKMTTQQLSNFMKLAGMGNWKTVAPTVNDDSTQGYVNGAFWFDEDAQRFYILNDNSAGAADWVLLNGGGVTDLQEAYDKGNVVNGATVTIDGVNNNFGVGVDALDGNTGVNVNSNGGSAASQNSGDDVNANGNSAAFQNLGSSVNANGNNAASQNTGNNVNANGNNAALQNTGNNVNANGFNAAIQNTGNNVNANGLNAGLKNTADDSNFFGQNAGYDSIAETGNTTSFGVTVFSPQSVPSYADHTAALAALTVANGCVAAQVYIYRNVATDAIGFVIPA